MNFAQTAPLPLLAPFAPFLAPVLCLLHLFCADLEFVIKMQRLTARLLLLFALAGNFLPVALAATTAPPRACCLRMAHKCHKRPARNPKQRSPPVAAASITTAAAP